MGSSGCSERNLAIFYCRQTLLELQRLQRLHQNLFQVMRGGTPCSAGKSILHRNLPKEDLRRIVQNQNAQSKKNLLAILFVVLSVTDGIIFFWLTEEVWVLLLCLKTSSEVMFDRRKLPSLLLWQQNLFFFKLFSLSKWSWNTCCIKCCTLLETWFFWRKLYILHLW